MIHIREAVRGDAGVLSEKAQRVAAIPGRLASHECELPESAFREAIERLARIPNGRFLVAESSTGELVGHAYLEPMHLKAVEHIVRLTMVVHEGHQNRGVGQQLLTQLIEWAKTVHSIEKIELNVRASNLPAVRLYQKLGFYAESRLKRRVKYPNGEYSDDIEMGLFLRDCPASLPFAGLAIGRVISSRTEVLDDDWDTVTSAVELDETQFTDDALVGLDEFSHVEVLFLMNQVDVRKIETRARHPRNNPEWPQVGIFAQRGKNRPNQIGSTICRIEKVEGLKLYLLGLDAVDGTPVLDIKPWVRQFGPRGAISQPAWMDELMKGYWKKQV